MEQPAPSEQKKFGLEKKVAEHQAELIGVELKLEEIERLEKIRSGFGPVREMLRSIDGTDDATEKLEAFAESIADCVTGKGSEGLLARKRELRQLIEQAKIDSAE